MLSGQKMLKLWEKSTRMASYIKDFDSSITGFKILIIDEDLHYLPSIAENFEQDSPPPKLSEMPRATCTTPVSNRTSVENDSLIKRPLQRTVTSLQFLPHFHLLPLHLHPHDWSRYHDQFHLTLYYLAAPVPVVSYLN